MTFQLVKEVHNGITYLDTPGLADISMRIEAARAITEALKQNGTYQIFFVITLEAGRFRPEDIATMKLVLQSSRDIKYYSIIINKLTKGTLEGLIEDNARNLNMVVAEVIKQIECVEDPPTLLLLSNRPELEDAKDGVVTWNELNVFAKQAPCTTIKYNSVTDINGEESVFERVMQVLVDQINCLRQDQKQTREIQRETEEKYRKLLQRGVIFSLTFFRFSIISLRFFSFHYEESLFSSGR